METRYHRYVRNYNIIAHIRNAFAHGRLNMFPLENEKDDYIFAFEDVKIGKTKKHITT